MIGRMINHAGLRQSCGVGLRAQIKAGSARIEQSPKSAITLTGEVNVSIFASSSEAGKMDILA